MTGSGTVSDPYLVADVYDFCSMNSGYYKLINDIDFNDHSTYKYGVTDGYIIGGNGAAIYLDGDGHEVRNIVCSNDRKKLSFNNGSVSNTNFANIIINSIGTSGSAQIYARGGFINCNFGYYLINSAFVTIFGNNDDDLIRFTNCTFNIAGKMYPEGSGFSSYFNMCHINFNEFNADSGDLFFPKSSGCGFNNSYITGLIKSSNMTYLFYNSKYNPIVRNSYIAVDNGTIRYIIYTPLSDQSKILSCFIDKTLMPNITNPPINVYLLTSEQFKDNNYLNSIGFLAIPV